MALARWRLADLPRLLAVDSRLSDRTVVRSRREFRQHAPATFCLLDLITPTIASRSSSALKPRALPGTNLFQILSRPCAFFTSVTSRQRGVTWKCRATTRCSILDHSERTPIYIRLFRSRSLEWVSFAKRCVRKFLASKKICWSQRRNVISGSPELWSRKHSPNG